jgi:hypothetical protein
VRTVLVFAHRRGVPGGGTSVPTIRVVVARPTLRSGVRLGTRLKCDGKLVDPVATSPPADHRLGENEPAPDTPKSP